MANLLGGKLDAADLRGRDDVARDANHEQITETLIEHDLDRHSRVGAAEDGGEGSLAGGELDAARMERFGVAKIGHETAVPVSQQRERLPRRYHAGLGCAACGRAAS